jgi:hypothetical protein
VTHLYRTFLHKVERMVEPNVNIISCMVSDVCPPKTRSSRLARSTRCSPGAWLRSRLARDGNGTKEQGYRTKRR